MSRRKVVDASKSSTLGLGLGEVRVDCGGNGGRDDVIDSFQLLCDYRITKVVVVAAAAICMYLRLPFAPGTAPVFSGASAFHLSLVAPACLHVIIFFCRGETNLAEGKALDFFRQRWASFNPNRCAVWSKSRGSSSRTICKIWESKFCCAFDDSPELLSLLPYGQSYVDAPLEDRADMLLWCTALRVHS